MPVKEISFKPIENTDLPLIFSWVNLPHVQAGYSHGVSTWEDVVEDYNPSGLRKSKIDGFIILFQNKYIGYVQKYLLDSGEYDLPCENAAGLDIFIGATEYFGQKLGKYILFQFLSNYIFSDNNIARCIINPHPENPRAIKTYEKVGFTYLKTIERFEGSPEYVMEITRATLIPQ